MFSKSGLFSVLSLALFSGVSMCATIPAAEYGEVVAVQIVSVTPGAWQPGMPQRRSLDVKAKVVAVLRDRTQKLSPETVDVTLHQSRWQGGRIGDTADLWSDTDPQPGDEYIAFANRNPVTLPTLIAEPDSLTAVGKSAAAADLKMIFRVSAAPEAEQAGAVIQALKERNHNGSIFLASFAAAVLGSGVEGAPVAGALASTADAAFPEDGKRALLFALSQQVRGGQASPALSETFGTLIARFFLDGHEAEAPPLSRLQTAVLADYLPWLDSSAQGKQIAQSIPPELASAFRQKLAQVERQPSVPSEWRSHATSFAKMMNRSGT